MIEVTNCSEKQHVEIARDRRHTRVHAQLRALAVLDVEEEDNGGDEECRVLHRRQPRGASGRRRRCEGRNGAVVELTYGDDNDNYVHTKTCEMIKINSWTAGGQMYLFGL